MPLESCMILLDNSEFMRNGDYIPTRMEAQNDAANLLVGQKTQSNPESTVGVIAMSGGSGSTGSTVGAELLVSPTDDMGKILSALHGIPIRGGHGDNEVSEPPVDVAASVQVASLALKHRRNKNGAQRIVLFVGSPLTNVETRTLTRAGKQLKKNNVAIDVIAMGELEENEPKLKELVDAANGSGGEGGERTCHLVTIPPGVLPSDVLVGSPIVHGGGGGGAVSSPGGMGGGGGGGGDMSGAFAEYGGVDPNMDPELAMALRVSMEEERARQERAAAAAAAAAAEEGKEESKDGEGMEMDESGTPAADAKPTAEEGKSDTGAEVEMGDEDALLQQALAMSMAESADAAPEEVADEKKPVAEDTQMEEDDDDEDAAMQLALQMSMNPSEEPSSAATSAEANTEGQQQEFQDPQFVNQVSRDNVTSYEVE
uniref:VWFA domain-containing protein n=1 Tax=Ditylum brightwellii TaxID=49249 RepID=A0A7S4WCF7_9STRA|mmetsp:Transcript_13907/g.18622  ORF Transcript_13907/g.18622 Transcript_13907/m.18622 type:complete len:428 (+) Transcript_13907:120-1403(+)